MRPTLSGRGVDAIVIGTSAGGIDALSAVLPGLRATTRASVFVVIHLPRDRPSLVAEVLASKCAVAVCEAQDKEPICRGVVYLAPPDYHLLIDDGFTLALSTDEPVNFSRPSIDVLFESAAEAYGRRLVGVVLTGANADGATGLARVRELGGVTVVQAPDSALAPLMVRSAISRTAPDYVLPLCGIAELFSTIEADDVG